MIRSKKYDVKEFLTLYPHLRDCDRKLVASIWKYQIVEKFGMDYNKMTAEGILQLFSDGKLGNPTSIRRARAKYQEEIPSLRGESWSSRHRHAVVVSEEIKNWNK